MNDGFERNCNQMFHLLNLKQIQIVTQTAGWWQTTTSLRRNKQLLPDSSLSSLDLSSFYAYVFYVYAYACVSLRVLHSLVQRFFKISSNYFTLKCLNCSFNSACVFSFVSVSLSLSLSASPLLYRSSLTQSHFY